MRDFPPVVTAYTDGSRQTPDTRSPLHLLWWLVREQGDLVLAACVFSALWFGPSALTPWVLGRAIDAGLSDGSTSGTAAWVGLLLVITLLGAGSGIFYHTVVVRSWLVALYGTIRLVTHKSVQLGHVLPRRTPTGEVLSIAGSDSDQFGAFIEIVTRSVGNLVAYLVVATIMLQISVPLGLVVLVVAPLLVLASTPLLRPMSRAQEQERSRDSDLTSMATDIVAGLRILRGIGGERTFGDGYASQSGRVREAGVRAGTWAAAVEAVGVLLSGLLVVVLMWLGVRQVRDGTISVGDLVTFLGCGLFMIQPIRTFFELAQRVTRALVSARKTVAVLSQPDPWPTDRTAALDPAADLHDLASGLVVPAGRLTMVVSADPEQGAALADRLGRYLPGRSEPVSLDAVEELTGRARRRARAAAQARRETSIAAELAHAGQPARVLLGGVDLADAPIKQVRSTVLVSNASAEVFAGTLQQAIDPHHRLTRERAELALHAASAEDVYDAMPGGWQGVLEERGRGLSGGQRQRVVLARALAADPPILVLVEPTSAVDAHTEARIAHRLPEARHGRTTVVVTASPLLLHHADQVALLVDGTVCAVGTHADLVASDPTYRRVVLRTEEVTA